MHLNIITGGQTGVDHAALDAALAGVWMTEREIVRPNVAGPRASKFPQGYAYAFALISTLLRAAP